MVCNIRKCVIDISESDSLCTRDNDDLELEKLFSLYVFLV